MADKKEKKENTQKQKTEKKQGKESSAKQEKEIRVPVRLQSVYKQDIAPELMKKFSYKSIMQVPRINKIVVNMGVGAAVTEPKILEDAVRDLETVTGQKASIRKAKKAISNFKLREGVNIGAMVTLRRERMYEFLDRLINIALPRVRDFRGLSDKSFDGRGNYTLGVKEQIIFPEINVDKITKVLGMDITIVTTAKSDNEAYELLQAFGVPFRKKEMKTV
ncbi:MAG: 50S ribosomal protein L5 [Ignavibacteriales bacterium]|nr:MAG: 50S ribosomal protein L5 [Ignavibacteriales bacterium]